MKIILQLIVIASALMLMTAVPDAQRQKRRGGNMFSNFHKLAELAIGKNAPTMHAKDSEGVELDIAEYRGRWVFVEFGSYT